MTSFYNQLEQYKHEGFSIIGYGASAKANVFLSSAHIYQLDYIIDDSSLKNNKTCPNINTVIKSIDVLEEYINKKLIVVILAWNLKKELTEKILKKSYDLGFVENPKIITY